MVLRPSLTIVFEANLGMSAKFLQEGVDDL